MAKIKGTLNQVEQKTSQKGTPYWRLLIGDRWHSSWEDPGRIPIGSLIHFDQKVSGDSGQYLNAANVEVAVPAPTVAPAVAGSIAMSSDGELRVISNVLAHAIAAGEIKQPAHLTTWVRELRKALAAPAATNDEPMDDDIPF